MLLLYLRNIIHIARIAQLVAEHRSHIGCLPVNPGQHVPLAFIERQQRARVLFSEVLQNCTALDDIPVAITQRRNLLVGIALGEVILKLLTFHQVDGAHFHGANINTGLDQFLDHDVHLPAVRRGRGP